MAQMNQDLQALYSELIDRMKQGVEMHEQLADYYAFLNLPGYQKCHEYQMLCELLTYKKAKNDYMREYNQLVQPNYMNNPTLTNMSSNMNNGMNNMANHNNYTQVIPQSWYKYTRYDVDSGTKRSAVKDGFKKWLDYENETKQYLVEMAKYLDQAGERESSRKLNHLIDHVEKEIEQAEEKLIALESAGYDMNYILQQQDTLKDKYAKKIRELDMYDYKRRNYRYNNYDYYSEYDRYRYHYPEND